MVDGLLVVVPCGHLKVWHREPNSGPAAARNAYIGTPFKFNREYAERFGERWVILSAKYGFVTPDCLIPGPYDVTFKRKSSGQIALETLVRQVIDLGLDGFKTVVSLGGSEYRAVVQRAFSHSPANITAPFMGLPIGRMMRAVKLAIREGVWDYGTIRQDEAPAVADKVGNRILARLEAVAPKPVGEPPKAEDFQKVLDSLLSLAQQRGEGFVDVRSRDLHRMVGGYPGTNHRMPVCCSVMRKALRPGDEVLEEPRSGSGAALLFRYRLPR